MNLPLSNDSLAPWLQAYQAYQKSNEDAEKRAEASRIADLVEKMTGVKAKYAEPNEQAALKKLQLENQYYGRGQESQIGLRNAQAGHAGAMTNELQYKLAHPGLMYGGDVAQLEYLRGNRAAGAPGQQPTPGIQAQEPDQVLSKALQQGQQGQNSPQEGELNTGNILTPKVPPAGQSEYDKMKPEEQEALLASYKKLVPNEKEALNHARAGTDLGDLAQYNGLNRDMTPSQVAQPQAANDEAGQLEHAILNKMRYGKAQSPEEELANRQETQNQMDYSKKYAQANTAASAATDMDRYINDFKTNYDKSTYKGTGLFTSGETPTRGIKAGLLGWHDFAPEQATDTAAQNMQIGLKGLIGSGRLTNYELQFLGGLKLNRAMTPKAVEEVSKIIGAANERVKEYPRFILAARTAKIDPQVADTLFNLYKDQRPILDPKTKSVNYDYKNSFKDYLTPDAVSSIQRGEAWQPPISDAEINHTMKEMHMTREEVIKLAKSRGMKFQPGVKV